MVVVKMAELGIAGQLQPNVMHQLEILRTEARSVRAEDVFPLAAVRSDHFHLHARLGIGQALPGVAGEFALFFRGELIGEAADHQGGAEALSGLARAFFYAGAKSLIVSHWDVDSDSAVDLMTGLFDALRKNPHLSHAEALRASMLRMISKGPYWAQPKLWAPFIVVGEPRKN